MAIIKKDGKRELFDREKLAGAIKQSVGKFFASEVEVERIISDIEDAVYAVGDPEVPSQTVGDIVLDVLARENDVAYVRFASVYHDFKTLDEFETILATRRQLKEQQARGAAA